MNGGDSDADLLLLNRAGGRLEPWATLPAPGGEDAEFFTIGDRAFLAVASIRTGAGPYQFAATSTIFEWRAAGSPLPGSADVRGQAVAALADRRQALPRAGPGGHRPARARRAGPGGQPGLGRLRVGRRAVRRFQPIPSQWAYNWHAFTAGGEYFVAHAEHAGPSVLYRWDGTRLAPHQTLAAESGRAFATFDDGDKSYLVVACIAAPTRLLRWDGARFTEAQVLEGLGARELAVTRCGGRTLLIRINFILGTPANPRPALTPRSTSGTATSCARSPRSPPAAAPTSRSSRGDGGDGRLGRAHRDEFPDP